ncbi:hypothetical protein ABBQ32_011001 [Trebouxia sp. C0010 RCD-2024]
MAVRVVTGNASFHPLSNTGQPLSPQPPPLASDSAPRRSGRARNPVSPYWKVPPAAPGGGSMSPPKPPSLQLLSLNVNGLRGKQKRAALFATFFFFFFFGWESYSLHL